MKHQTMRPRRRPQYAFTLVELMIVIGVIVLLIGILIPVVSRVRLAAQEASTKAFIAELSGAMDTYHTDHSAYPGPFSNDQICTLSASVAGPNVLGLSNTDRITEAENATLGLVGGLTTPPPGSPVPVQYSADLVGKGASSLNTAQPKRWGTYLSSTGLSTGHYSDESGDANDTLIPEFLDRFNNPMPILILRANVGRTSTANPPQPNNNNIITNGSNGGRLGNYDISQIIGYTGAYSGSYPALSLDVNRPPAATARSIGMGKDLPEVCTDGSGTMQSWKNRPGFHGLRIVDLSSMTSNTSVNDAQSNTKRNLYYFPYDAYAYFTNPQMPVPTTANQNVIPTPRQKDRYILISAGKDRIYGTDDDITNFGPVGQ